MNYPRAVFASFLYTQLHFQEKPGAGDLFVRLPGFFGRRSKLLHMGYTLSRSCPLQQLREINNCRSNSVHGWCCNCTPTGIGP